LRSWFSQRSMECMRGSDRDQNYWPGPKWGNRPGASACPNEHAPPQQTGATDRAEWKANSACGQRSLLSRNEELHPCALPRLFKLFFPRTHHTSFSLELLLARGVYACASLEAGNRTTRPRPNAAGCSEHPTATVIPVIAARPVITPRRDSGHCSS
jgi:hypothetical protein